MLEFFIVILIFFYGIYLRLEYTMCQRIRKQFIHVIHVNGTRGKSTVARLIDAGLRESGFKIFTKTTGTVPTTIDVEGVETEIKRKGSPNIKEQIRIMRQAYKQGAQILIIECMAVKPELQRISQEKIVMADITVVTNVRRDHLEEIGPTLRDVAISFGGTMPYGGLFMTAEKDFYQEFEHLGKERNTKTILVQDPDDYRGISFNENVSLALAVCREIGVSKEDALKGMRKYKKDPGSLSIHKILTKYGKYVYFVNAFAANDPDSTLKIYEDMICDPLFQNVKLTVLINNRWDRPIRMKQFAVFVKNIKYDKIWITGNLGDHMERKLTQEGVNKDKIIRINRLYKEIFTEIREDMIIFAVGNIGGQGKEIMKLIREVGEDFHGLYCSIGNCS